jgi:hypothetical protein
MAGPEGEICYVLRRAARFQVAVLIRKPHDRVRVSDVHPLWIWAGRIERDAVRPIEATREDLNLLGFGIGSDSAEAFDVAGIAFCDEVIAGWALFESVVDDRARSRIGPL